MTVARDTLLGKLDANETIGPFHVRGRMAADCGVLSIIGDVLTAGAGTVTVEYYVDAAATKGGPSTDLMDTTTGYILHKAISPDLWIKLTMSGRNTDDIDFYMV